MHNSFEPQEIELFARLIDEAAQRSGQSDDLSRSVAAMRPLAARGERDRQKLIDAIKGASQGSPHAA